MERIVRKGRSNGSNTHAARMYVYIYDTVSYLSQLATGSQLQVGRLVLLDGGPPGTANRVFQLSRLYSLFLLLL
jgi:hypothetical protein